MAVATEQLSFKKLFCDPNPYFDPYSANLEESDVDHTTEDTEKMQLDPETGLPMRPAVQPLFPHVEPPMSASARESAKCFNFDEFNASTPAGQYPYEWNPDWRLLRDFLAKEGRLSIEAALELVKRTRNILQRESNVLRLRPPYTCAFNAFTKSLSRSS